MCGEGLAWQLSSHLIVPIHSHIVHVLSGPVQWTGTCLPSASGGVCPALSTGGLALRVEGHEACHTPQPELQRLLVKQDLPLLPNGSGYPDTCPSGADAFPATGGHGE